VGEEAKAELGRQDLEIAARLARAEPRLVDARKDVDDRRSRTRDVLEDGSTLEIAKDTFGSSRFGGTGRRATSSSSTLSHSSLITVCDFWSDLHEIVSVSPFAVTETTRSHVTRSTILSYEGL
jgi:hypothetical protein